MAQSIVEALRAPASDALHKRAAEEIERLTADLDAIETPMAFVEWLRAQLAEAKRLNRMVVCVWCGETRERSADPERAALEMVEHGMACEKRPEARLADRIDQLREKVRRLRRHNREVNRALSVRSAEAQRWLTRAHEAERRAKDTAMACREREQVIDDLGRDLGIKCDDVVSIYDVPHRIRALVKRMRESGGEPAQ